MTHNLADLELHYHDIAELYDLADELVDTVEQSSNPEEQLRTVEPLIDQIGESADILCEEFIEVAGKKQKAPSRKTRIEGALRKLYIAMDSYHRAAAKKAKDATTGLRNIADPIVSKIKRQVEGIIAMLVDFIDLSLDRIMQKQHIDELKRRQEKIANMLYVAEQQSMGLGSA